MTYVEGFIVAVPTANREAYRKQAADAAPMFREFGVARHVEAWDSDIPDGKVTDFRKAVQAKEDEAIVFSWFEYPSRAARDAANEKIMSDPRMEEMGAEMPFDGQRMIMAGFDSIVDEGDGGRGSYVDGIIVPVPDGNKDAYRDMATKTAAIFREYGALRVVEGWGDDIPDGKVTDYRRAAKAEPGENVVFSWIEWPSKQHRDDAWQKIMQDERMKHDGDMPFDGKRMFWGGFDMMFDTGADAR